MRISTHSNFSVFVTNMQRTLEKLVKAQGQAATGIRIQRPSDDPIGTAQVLNLQQRLASNERFIGGIQSSLPVVDASAAALQDTSTLLIRIRELVVQGMNGTLDATGRESIASEIENLRDNLLGIANSQFGQRFLFSGTATSTRPYEQSSVGGFERVGYVGNDDQQTIEIGQNAKSGVNLPGSEIFSANEFSGTKFSGLSGVESGETADIGSSYEYLTIRHTATDPGGIAAAGVALAGGGANDTFLGVQDLIIDPVAGTIQLGDGEPRNLPDVGSPDALDFVVENELGGELHLDLSGWNGAALATTVEGQGEISLDGTNFEPLDFVDTDLELRNEATGAVVHVDTTGIRAAKSEIVAFEGSVNVFDTLQGIVDELRGTQGAESFDLAERMAPLLEEFDRNHGNVLTSLSTLGARSARLSSSDDRVQGVSVQIEAMLSSVRDTDLNEALTELAENQQILTMIQASGARILQQTLLNFL